MGIGLGLLTLPTATPSSLTSTPTSLTSSTSLFTRSPHAHTSPLTPPLITPHPSQGVSLDDPPETTPTPVDFDLLKHFAQEAEVHIYLLSLSLSLSHFLSLFHFQSLDISLSQGFQDYKLAEKYYKEVRDMHTHNLT